MSEMAEVRTGAGTLWVIERIGRTNLHKIYPKADPAAIVMTGDDVATQFRIPFPHRWVRTHFYHTTVDPLVVSNNYLRITLRREVGKLAPANYSDELFCEFQIVVHFLQEHFGEGFEYEPAVWTLILNSTATDLLFPVFYVQKLEP